MALVAGTRGYGFCSLSMAFVDLDVSIAPNHVAMLGVCVARFLHSSSVAAVGLPVVDQGGGICVAGRLASDWGIPTLALTAVTSEAAELFSTSRLALGCPCPSVFTVSAMCVITGGRPGGLSCCGLRLKLENETICHTQTLFSFLGVGALSSCRFRSCCELGTGSWFVSRDGTFKDSVRMLTCSH